MVPRIFKHKHHHQQQATTAQPHSTSTHDHHKRPQVLTTLHEHPPLTKPLTRQNQCPRTPSIAHRHSGTTPTLDESPSLPLMSANICPHRFNTSVDERPPPPTTMMSIHQCPSTNADSIPPPPPVKH
jgi:hypothetical protein